MPVFASDLPPANSLVAFEAAARHLSIKLAAQELKVTPAAVSRHVSNLEQHLGCRLFERLHRRVRLTPQGQSFYRSVADGLSTIAGAARQIAAEGEPMQVTVGSTLGFASLWLMPRIPAFTAAHPEIALRYVVSNTLTERQDAELDLLVLYGRGRWPGYQATLLFDDELIAVASPTYLREHPELRRPADLSAARLIHLESENRDWETWPIWFQRVGIGGPPPRGGERFNDYVMAIQAAIEGHGVLLGWRRLLRDHLGRGALMQAVPAAVPAQGGYFQLVRADRPVSPATRLLQDWIAAAAAAAA
jgi:DNA-binding transcriptional LysR family regulator